MLYIFLSLHYFMPPLLIQCIQRCLLFTGSSLVMELDEASKLKLRNMSRAISQYSGFKEASDVFLHLLCSDPDHNKSHNKTHCWSSLSLARSYFLSGPYEDGLYNLLHAMQDVEFTQSYSNTISDLFSSGPESIVFEVCMVHRDTNYSKS